MTDRRLALVSGAGGTIGAAISRRLIAEGMAVAALDRDRGQTTRLAHELGPGVMAVECDITSEDDVHVAVSRVEEHLGPIETLVNNAGILGPPGTPLIELGRSDWDAIFAVNVTGAWNLVRHIVPGMAARRCGCVVNIASGAAYNGVPGIGAYGASKAALLHLTKTLALEHAKDGVRCVAVCPANVDTPMLATIADSLAAAGDPDPAATLVGYHALPRLATPDDVAGVVAFLVSSDASFLTGSAVLVDGGALAGRSG